MKFSLRFGKILRSLKLEGILFLTVFFLGLGALLASPQENKLRRNYELPDDAYSNLAQPVRPKATTEELSFRYFPPSKDRKKAPPEFQNVRILYLDSASFLSNMAFMAKSLGVRCQYCHDLKDFASESIPAKQRAREMIQMVEAMNATQTASPVDCYTCHRGQTLAVAAKAEEPRTESHVTDGDPPPADPPVLEDKDLAEGSETIEEERPDTSPTEGDVDGKEAVALAKDALFGTLLSHGTDYIQEIGRETFGEHFQVEANLRFERGISGDIDILLPFWSVEGDSTWFFQPGLVLWRDKHGTRRQDVSFGLGHRFHWSDSIVGLGGFLDYGLGYGHSRLGVSVDYQSDAGYLSVNLYEGLSSWKKGRSEGEIQYQEIAMSGTELYWDYAVTEFLRLQGRASTWRLQDRNDQRDARTGYEVGFAYRLQSGTELVGGYSHYDQIHKNHWNLGLRFNLPSARDSVGGGSAPDLFRPIEREKRIFTEERVIKFSLAPPQLGARSRQTVFQGEVFAIEVPALPQRPMADVVITPSHSGPVFVEYSTQRDGPFNAALTLRFTPDNWDQGKTIWARIQPLSESRHADHGRVASNAVLPVIITLNYQSSDPRYDGLTASLTVEVFGTTATTLSQESLVIVEGLTGTYTIVLNSEPAADVEIEMVSDNVDVTVTPPSLTFTSSNWSVAQTATVAAAQDDDIADDSATISHRATSSDTDYHDIYINDISVTVADDDLPTVTLVLSPSSIDENGGSSTVTATLDYALSETTTVTVSATAVSPAVPGDFTLSTNKELIIAAGQKESTGTVTITAMNNNVDAPDKSVTVSATVSNSQEVTAPSDVTLTILDDEGTPTVTLALSASSIGENGGSSTVTASLNRASSETTTVTVSATAVSPAVAGDFTLSGTTLTIAAGSTSSTGTVTITANDNTVDAPDKSVTVSATASNDQGVTNPSDETLTITDDEGTPTVTLLLSAPSIGENGGSSTVTASLNHASSEATTITVSAVAVSPAVTGDFTLSMNKELTITAGNTSSTGTVTITAVNNDVDAPNKSVTVSATASNDQGVTNPSDETLTITDDEGAPTVTLSLDNTSIDENGGVATVTASLNHASSRAVTVTVSAAAVSPAVAGDFTLSTNKELTIAANATTSTGMVTITANDNTVDASNKSVTVSGTVSDTTNFTAPPNVTLTILDDEGTPTVTLSLSASSITENGGSSTVTASLNRASSRAVTVTVSAVAVSPAVAGDFTLSTNKELTIAANATTSTGTVTITANDNTVDAPNKSVTVSGTVSDTTNFTAPPNVTLMITDNDAAPTVTLALSSSSIGENGGSTTVTASLNHASSEATTITVSATAVSPAVAGDFTLSTNKELTIAAGSTTSTGTVTITAVGNTVDAPNKSVTVSGSASNDQGVTVPSNLTLTITDDDVAPTVTLSLSASSITENGGSSTVTASLNHASSEDTTITVSATAVSPAVAGDFTLSMNKELTITAGNTSSTGTVTITAVNNDVDAPDKSATVSATASNDQGVTAPSNLTLTITDDDAAPTVTLSLSASSITENGGSSTVTASLNHASSEATTITVSAAAVSPAVAGDFTLSTNKELTIAAGSTTSTGTVTITAVNNDVEASDKSVTVSATASNDQGVTAPSNLTLTITDDDGPDGESLYTTKNCNVCHDSGIGGAPAPGSQDDFGPRLRDRMLSGLYDSAINGIPNTIMSARGGSDATDAELRAIVDYMVEGVEASTTTSTSQ